MMARINGFSLAGNGRDPTREFRVSLCPAMASSCRDRQGSLAVFPALGLCLANAGPAFPALWPHQKDPDD
jgi:hypothetical protein